ncbi:hypothetical protein T492DRAFT_1064156 [Pavlovales sp. CCMP2436]|nr:hypothetical protein T492DRAFT_1064156 [Pavlovales sp. CCMP2436]
MTILIMISVSPALFFLFLLFFLFGFFSSSQKGNSVRLAPRITLLTPSDATPSDGTPDNVTPSDVTPSLLTPSRRCRGFYIFLFTYFHIFDDSYV